MTRTHAAIPRAEPSPRPASTRLILVGGLAIFVTAPIALAVTGHTSLIPSPDSDARLSLWSAVLPVIAGLLVARAVPPTVPVLLPELAKDRRALIGQTWVTLAAALLTPTIVFAILLAGFPPYPAYSILKLVLLLLLPGIAFALLDRRAPGETRPRRRERLWRPSGAWRWWGPAPAILVYAYLVLFSPLRLPPTDLTGLDPVFVVVAAALTFVTANVTEEIFYRVLLQTRLEAILGHWPGIVSGALLFAFAHLPTHAQGGQLWQDLPLTVGAIVTFQGFFGLFAGYLWFRFRNVWILIAAHTIINTLPLFR